MSFFEKLKAAIRKIKNKLIVYLVLVIIIILMLVLPFSIAVTGAKLQAGYGFLDNPMGEQWWDAFFTIIAERMVMLPHKSIGLVFQPEYAGMFFGTCKYIFIIAAFFALIGILKAIPKHEYQDIENGSSDWCEGGEQYKVLSKNKGLVLAEKNYLPLDKRGNVNILVVRRFWCW